MVAFKLVSAAAFAGVALAAPAPLVAERATGNIDTTVLQFALTLEHLENVFYKQALQKFSVSDFQQAGYSADYYNDLKYIAYDEQTHVQALSAALTAAGVTPNKACTYSFNYTTVAEFITLSSVLEGVGTSAYLGAAPLITSKAYLTVAGSILAVEALHTSLQRLAIGEISMANPFMTPLDPNSVYTLALAFIKTCPTGNAALPFKAFPSLSVAGKGCTCEEPNCSSPSVFVKRQSGYAGGNWWGHGGDDGACAPATTGATVTFQTTKKIPAGSYVTFVNGLTVTSVKGTNSNGAKAISAKIPSTITGGQTYVFITKSDVETTFDDTQVLFGPAILEVKPAAPAINYSQS